MNIEKAMEKRINKMALRTWDAIGGDILAALEEEGKKPIMSRDDVIEIVADADYMLTYGGDVEAYRTWQSLPTLDVKYTILKKAFTFSQYGW